MTVPLQTESDGWFEFVLPIDCSTLSTAQQKKISFVTHRVFTNKKVTATKKIVSLLARQYRTAFQAAIPPSTPIELEAIYYYSYPKGTPKKRLIEGFPKTNGADLDNIHKAVQDALGPGDRKKQDGAHLWSDDRLISTLHLRKRYTLESSRIVFRARPDTSDLFHTEQKTTKSVA